MSPGTLRLVQLLPNARVGGAERVALELVRGAAAMWGECDQHVVVMRREKDQISDLLGQMGVPVTVLGAWGRLDPRVLWRLDRAIPARRAPTIIHAHTARPAVLGCTLRLVTRRPTTRVLYTAHSRLRHPVARGLSRVAGMASDRVVAVSGAVAASLAPRDRVPSPLARKLQVIPNGVDVEATEEAARGWEAVRGQLGIPPTRHLLVAPANIRFAKGQDVLFRALALLPDMDFALLLAGQEERIGRRWRGLANRLGVANRVHWLGFRSDLPRLLRAADVVVMASRREGLPLALLEALVLGALPVVTDVGEMGTIVRETRGWVVPPGEPNAFAHALRQAMVGRERHRELSNRGASLVRERYSSTTMVAAYLRCYSEMAATLRDTNTS